VNANLAKMKLVLWLSVLMCTPSSAAYCEPSVWMEYQWGCEACRALVDVANLATQEAMAKRRKNSVKAQGSINPDDARLKSKKSS
jgi:hypothetical protein